MAKPKAKTLQERMCFTDTDLKTPGHDAIMLWLDEQTTRAQIAAWLRRNGWIESDLDARYMSEYLQEFLEPYESALASARRAEASTQENIAKWQAGIDGTKRVIHGWGQWAEEVPINRLREWLTRAQAELPALTKHVVSAAQALQAAKEQAAQPDPLPWPGFSLTKKQWEMPVMSGSYTVGFIDFVAHYQYPQLKPCRPGKDFPSWAIEWQDRQICFEVKTTIPSLGELLRQLGQYREYLKRPYELNRSIFVVSPDARFAEKICEQGYGFIQYPRATVKTNGNATDNGWLFGRQTEMLPA